MVDAGLTVVYVTALLASGAVALGVGLWAYLTSDVPERRLFLGLMGLDATWAVVAAVGLVTTNPTATLVLAHVRVTVALTVMCVWYGFATVYTGRTIRQWRHAAILTPVVLTGLGAATNPLHRWHWQTTTYQSEPLSYVTTTTGPIELFGSLWVFLIIGISLYYLGELFVKSRHRASVSLLVLLAGAVAASVPNVLSNLKLVPVPGYDHTVFGVAAFVVAAGYAIFGLGMFDIRPIARDNLVDEVDDALLVLDGTGTLVDYNAASRTLFVESLDGDPIGQPLSVVCPPVAEAVTLDGHAGSETTDVVSVGQTHYSGQVTPVTENDEVVGYSVVLRDVTAQVEYRRELEQRNEQLDQFASAVAHDLRNPLQVAFGHARLLESEVPDRVETNGDFDRTIDRLTASLDRMDDIIRDLRTLAKQGQSVQQTELVDFEAVVADAWETVDAERATLAVEQGGTIEAERSRLLSILENLFRNGIDHASPAVNFSVTLTEDGFIVADDGPGIPEDARERVFEYGYTTDESGSGLGLAIVKTMVTAHGWSISPTESDDGGAAFVVTGATTEPTDRPQAPKE